MCINLFLGEISLGMEVVPSSKIDINLIRIYMRSYPVKENHIGSAVTEILWYKQTDIESSCYFIIRVFLNLIIFL